MMNIRGVIEKERREEGEKGKVVAAPRNSHKTKPPLNGTIAEQHTQVRTEAGRPMAFRVWA